MKWARAVSHYLLFVLLVTITTACAVSSDEEKARETANLFWQAVQQDKMETAKEYVTWDSAQYLQFLRNKQVSSQRFETGELKIENDEAELATVLYGGDKGDMEIPLRTVMVKSEDVWRVDVQRTMGSMVSGAMGAVVNQLNNFMQDGLKGLDDALSESIDELGKNLEKGMKELQKDLTPPPAPGKVEEKAI